MRAMEQRTLFQGVNYDLDKNFRIHQQKLKAVKKVIDNEPPRGYEARTRSPNKKLMARKAVKDNIYRENFFLAKRIFDIMEGESELSEKINDTRHLDNHPGTMNFKARLEEAQRIHYHNMLLASRLNSVQPHYKTEDVSVVRSVRSRSPTTPHRSKKTKFLRELEYTLRMAGGNLQTPRTAEYDEFGNPRWTPASPLMGRNYYNQDDDLNPAQDFEDDGIGGAGNNVLNDDELRNNGRPRSILLEYTKVQEGHVLDIAVIKEPYRDRYAIFGKDIEDGQRYELRLTSEEVSNILDGDILVTSVDNVEVWMALLHKVELHPVEQFSQLAPPNEQQSHQERLAQQYTKSAVKQQHQQPNSQQQKRIPSAPESYMRPSYGQEYSDPAALKVNRGGRVIRDKNAKPDQLPHQRHHVPGRTAAVEQEVMAEIDSNLQKVEEAAKARVKMMSKEKQQRETPSSSQQRPRPVVPAVDVHTVQHQQGDPQTARTNQSVDVESEQIQSARTQASAASQPAPQPSKPVAPKATSPRNAKNTTEPIKPRPPNKPAAPASSSFPASQPTVKRNANNYKERANTMDKMNNKLIPAAIEKAVAAVDERPKTRDAKKRMLDAKVKETVSSLVDHAIHEAIQQVKLQMQQEASRESMPVPFNTVDFTEVPASNNNKPPFRAIDVERSVPSPLNFKNQVPESSPEKKVSAAVEQPKSQPQAPSLAQASQAAAPSSPAGSVRSQKSQPAPMSPSGAKQAEKLVPGSPAGSVRSQKNQSAPMSPSGAKQADIVSSPVPMKPKESAYDYAENASDSLYSASFEQSNSALLVPKEPTKNPTESLYTASFEQSSSVVLATKEAAKNTASLEESYGYSSQDFEASQ